MKILFKYFTPYVLSLFLTILLLFIQAYTNLALPDYMSDIVNIGIQQGGIIDAVPMTISKNRMDKLLLFMKTDEASFVMDCYGIIQNNSQDNTSSRQDIPPVQHESVYILNDIDGEARKAINHVMDKAWLALSGTGKTQNENIQAAVKMVKKEYEYLGIDTGKLQMQSILHTGAKMLLYTLIAAFSAIATGFLSARIAAGFSKDIRLAIFTHIENFSAEEFDTFSTASLITRTTNDVMQIQTITVMLVTMVFYAPIIGIGGVIRALEKSSSMWWILALAVAVLMAIVLTVYKITVPKFTLLQKLMDKLNLVSRENLSGLLVIRAFNRQEHEEKKFDSVNKDLTRTMLFVNRVMVVMMPLMMLIMNGLSVVILWVGTNQVAASQMQVGDIMAFMQYAMQIVFAFIMLSMMFIMLPRAAVSARRITEVLNMPLAIQDPVVHSPFEKPFIPTIEFKQVCFRYRGAETNAVENINFTARPGQITAIIGATGSGKSTLVNLIPRFHDVTEGSILVGGKDIKTVKQHILREKIGYIPQKSVLFSGTVTENIQYGSKKVDRETVETAVRISQSEEFIKTLEGGMESGISQRGSNVSGGQKQRLSIARALVKKTPIYIFDDSFSALDFTTEAKLRRALHDNLKASTMIIVAQRVSTIKNAHQIIVLDNGKVAGKGTHKELMKTSTIYREIATSQLTQEELA